jgi:hypothetical protein
MANKSSLMAKSKGMKIVSGSEMQKFSYWQLQTLRMRYLIATESTFVSK